MPVSVGVATDTTLVSASELSSYGRCARRWAFSYILGLREEAGAAADLGIEVDDRQLQPYFKTGAVFDYTLPSDAGYIAASGMAYYPKPSEHTKGVQHHWMMPSPVGIVGSTPRFGYHGFMDLWMPDGAHVPDQRPGYPVVIDFKTTSDFKWAKTPTGLAADNQAMLYAIWALYKTRRDSVDLNWLYLRTRGAKAARRVHLRVFADRSEYVDKDGVVQTTTGALDALVRIDAAAHAMVSTGGTTTDPLTLEANPEACNDFGKPCPHQAKCNLGPSELIDALAAKAARRNPLTKDSPDMALDTNWLTKMKQKSAGIPATAPSSPPAPAPQTDAEAFAAWKAAQAANAGPAINPPESALPDAPAVGVTTAAPKPAAAPGAPTKRFRRTKAQMAAAAAAAAGGTTDEDSDEDDATPTLPPPAPSFAGAAFDPELRTLAYPSSDEGDSVHVTWGVERYQPLPFYHFEVGPHSTTGTVRKGETRAAAVARLYAGLDAFAAKERMQKAEAFRATIGGVK